jgi:hypothetical protein
MSDQDVKWEVKKWKNATIMAIIIIILDVIALLLGTVRFSYIGWSVGSVGIITFLGILMVINYLSKSPSFCQGEMRKAIAGAFVVVYFSFISLSTFSGFNTTDTELSKTLIDNFTVLMEIIVVFYFGSRSVDLLIERKYKNKDKQESPSKNNRK